MPVLTWTPGFGATHEIFFGTDVSAVSALEKKGSGNLGAETYEPGQLEWNTTYYWRVDEANNTNARIYARTQSLQSYPNPSLP